VVKAGYASELGNCFVSLMQGRHSFDSKSFDFFMTLNFKSFLFICVFMCGYFFSCSSGGI